MGPRLLGSDRTKTRWFLTHAISLCGLTAGIAALGNVLLSRWPQLYAHLIIELVAVLVFLSTVGMAIANAYINDGVLTSVVVTVAPLAGLFGYLFMRLSSSAPPRSLPLHLIRYYRSELEPVPSVSGAIFSADSYTYSSYHVSNRLLKKNLDMVVPTDSDDSFSQ